MTDVAGTVETVDHLAARGTVRILVKPADQALQPHVRVTIDEDRFPTGIARGSLSVFAARLAPPPPMALPRTYRWLKLDAPALKSTGGLSIYLGKRL